MTLPRLAEPTQLRRTPGAGWPERLAPAGRASRLADSAGGASARAAVTSMWKGVLVGDIGWQELLIIFVILLLLFGATRLPALSKSLGQSIRGFRQALKEDEPEPADSAEKLSPEGGEHSVQA